MLWTSAPPSEHLADYEHQASGACRSAPTRNVALEDMSLWWLLSHIPRTVCCNDYDSSRTVAQGVLEEPSAHKCCSPYRLVMHTQHAEIRPALVSGSG